jgi:hypothetical protein
MKLYILFFHIVGFIFTSLTEIKLSSAKVFPAATMGVFEPLTFWVGITYQCASYWNLKIVLRIRMLLDLLVQDPLVRDKDPDPSIIKQK